jgi:hypothetical protein
MPNIDLSILNQRQTPAFFADTLANRPAAGFLGRIFVSTDTFAFYRDNGTGWDLIGGPGTGTITGSGANGQIALWSGASTIVGDSGLTYDASANSLTASKFIVTGGTSTQFLKGDGTLDSNTYNTGSGAASQVAFFSGTNAITGENNLWWDSVNNRLGINTNAPGTALDIHNDTNALIQLNQTTATNDTRIAFQNSGTALWRIGNYYNAGANDWGIFDVVGGIEPFSIKKTTGQTFIGTQTTTSGRLVVNNATGDNHIVVIGATAPSLRINNSGSGATKQIGIGLATTTNNFIQGAADRDMAIFNSSTTASPILFGIYDAGAGNTQEAARISAARNFIVGKTTDTGQKLQISGTTLLSGNTTITSSSTNQLTLDGGTTIQSRIVIARGSDDNAQGMTIGYSNITSYRTSTPLASPQTDFSLNQQGSDGTRTVLYMSSSGNLSINSTNDGASGLGINNQQNLTFIEGSGQSYVNLFRQRNSAAGVLAQGLKRSITGEWASSLSGASARSAIVIGYNNGSIAFYSESTITVPNGTDISITPKMLLQNTGNLLIGTTTDAGQKLQVNGSSYLNGDVNLSSYSSAPTISVPSGTASVINLSGGTIFNYFAAVPDPYTQDIRIDIVFGNWGANPVAALVDIMTTLREYAGTSGVTFGKIFANSPSATTFTSFDTSNITTSQCSLTASSGGNYTLRIQINPTSNTDRYGIYLNIQNGGIGTAISSITITYV